MLVGGIRAFKELKRGLIEANSLHTPVIGLPCTIQCDASSIGIGAYLSQQREGILYPISYAVRNWLKLNRLGQLLKERPTSSSRV